ncbi:MAG: NAD(P)/FAD-dependent oxidoreductase [Caulobacteraceae bacterium]
MNKIVIVGTGQAGAQTALSLRDEGFAGDITLVGEEPGLPYQRPPLSKAYLLGKMDDEGILLRAPSAYDDANIEIIGDTRAVAIARKQRRLMLSAGKSLAYDHLVLATGARASAPCPCRREPAGRPVPAHLEDAKALMARMAATRRAVVVGGGFIGLEFAAVAAAQGIAVTVVEVAGRTMGRALSEEMSSFFEARHSGWGVEFRFGVGVSAILGEGQVQAVQLTDGATLEADLVLVGIGVVPNASWPRPRGWRWPTASWWTRRCAPPIPPYRPSATWPSSRAASATPARRGWNRCRTPPTRGATWRAPGRQAQAP